MSEQVVVPDKMVPHNVEAEQAVLGALLIDPDAIFKVNTFVHADAFYVEKHRWLYDAISILHERREAVDFVTLCDELERRQQLAEIGGPAYITSLINATPTALNVEYYGHIVERTSTLRRLIGAAGEIAALAYEDTDDVGETVDRAEQILFGVSQRRTTRDLMPIRDVVSEYYDRIDYLYRHKGETIGVPTGFRNIDKLLGGLQRSDLIIVASRPGMGKTSLMLSIAQNAARKYNQRVAIFSLEMSSEQLVQRLISAETGIDSQRLRIGNLRDDEWPTFIQATGALSETMIFIDDTPSISAMQVRTKARRLYAEYGLDLLIIDYLQLMQSDRRTENRVQEVSFLSRALKGLARELNIPVLVGSQLSRAVEQRNDKRPMLSDLRESGCLAGDTLVQLADGRRIPILELAESGHAIDVMALNERTWRLEPARARKAWKTGTRPILKMTTQLGHTIRATGNHKFRTLDGWKRLDAMSVGDHIALPRSWERLNTAAPTLTSDVIPKTAWQSLVEPARQALGIGQRDMQAAIGTSYSGTALYRSNMSRQRALRVSRVVQSQELERLAASEVYWDQVATVEPDGVQDVYDLEVPGHHNFVANGIVAHNSIEQDADIVIFLYRDEYYTPETEQPNIAEIIVSKHRNGPTGMVPLFFRRELAQFCEVEMFREDLEFA
jgi:replicative DNA helicase